MLCLWFSSTDEYEDACDLWEVFESAKGRSSEELEKMRQQQQNQEDDEGYVKKKVHAQFSYDCSNKFCGVQFAFVVYSQWSHQ